jgi:uncharacterized membrane protein
MNRWLTIALVGVTLAIGALTLGTAPQLPGRVATHFDWNGRANGWMDRETYVIVALAYSIALPWFVYGLMLFLRRVRDKDYWLAAPRRDATLRALGAFAAATALAIALLAATMHLMIVQAHAMQPPRVDNGTLVTAIVLFAAAMIGLAIAHGLRFRRRPDRALQR